MTTMSIPDGIDYVMEPQLEALPFTTRPLPGWKRAMDVAIALPALVVGAPLLLLIALAVAIDSAGSPLFGQTRVGYGGRCFTCWKFRSMRQGADRLWFELLQHNEAHGKIFKLKDDPRTTRVGKILRKTSLDELPQLWNVLRGDMSIVGPRPPLIREVVNYSDDELKRLSVVPGITGLWQVTSRHRHDFADMVELDIAYAEGLSLALDIKILALTIPTVFLGRGSY
jgi:lipopolysaccharide/colanic/teichoic acid biosynthesis glycosyltransferase